MIEYKKRGKGAVPFGWKHSLDHPGYIESIPAEQEALKKAIHYYLHGGYSLRSAMAWLKQEAGRELSLRGFRLIAGKGDYKYTADKLSVEDITPIPPPPKIVTPPEVLAQRALDRREKRTKVKLQKIRKEEKKVKDSKTRIERNVEKVKQEKAILSGKATLVTTDQTEAMRGSIAEVAAERTVIFEPNPGPQTEFLAANEKEVFYGGARGGGKSYSLIVDPLRYVHKERHRALILRRTMPELRDMISHTQRIYTAAGGKWREQEKEWKFPSGARIEFGFAENVNDALRYQGQAYTWIGVDELPQYPDPKIWNDLRGSLRSVDPGIPEFMRATGNPGNVGSDWVKQMFIEPAPWGDRFYEEIELPDGSVEKISRRFIPAKLTDNPYLTRTKAYMTMLASLPEIQRRQWLEGDWDAWDGAAFPEFRREIHTCEPFTIPNSWQRFRACDWGYSSAFAVLWFAIDYDDNLWVYREFYGNRLTADVFAQEVLRREAGERIQYGVLDSSVWARRGDVGPSIVEEMAKYGLRWRPSDRSPGSRKNGKVEVHRRLRVQDDPAEPKLKLFNTCRQTIRDLPTLPLDDNDPEDVDTKCNDHTYDALRYGCMSRPLNPARMDWLSQQVENERFVASDVKFGY